MPESGAEKRLQKLGKGLVSLLEEFGQYNQAGNTTQRKAFDDATHAIGHALNQIADQTNRGVAIIGAAQALADFITSPKNSIRPVRTSKLLG